MPRPFLHPCIPLSDGLEIPGGVVLEDITIEPRKLGSDLRISKLLQLRGEDPRSGFVITPPGSNTTYLFKELVRNPEVPGMKTTYNASVKIIIAPRDLAEGVTDQSLSTAWVNKRPYDLLDRKEFMATWVHTVHHADFLHFGHNLVGAVHGKDNAFWEQTTLAWRAMYEDLYGLHNLPPKPLSVCAQCGLHTVFALKHCPCRKDLHYCSRRCQKAHWRAGHRAEH